MSRCQLRFIHSSDLQLHRPPVGPSSLPDDLKQVLIDSQISAARNVFDAALANAVDFVVISGNVIDVEQASPKALRFLVEQFHRLEQRDIAVYWAGGPRDVPSRWPAGLALPDNVHHFTADKVESHSFIRDGKTLAVITGASNTRERFRPGDYRPGRDGVFTIGVTCGEASQDEMSARAINYWALGGRNTAETLTTEPHVVRYSGAPQGLNQTETGKHGATLVSLDDAGEVRLQSLACDVVRFHNEQLSVAAASTSDEELFQQLVERTGQLITGAPDRHLLVRWSLLTGPQLGQQLQHDGLAAMLTTKLQQHFAARKPCAWTCEIQPASQADVSAELYEEDTILGDFLRSLRTYQQSKNKALNLETLLHNEVFDAEAAAAIRARQNSREQLLSEVATMGVQLLSGASMTESGAAKIQFSTGGKSMALKHDGQSWEAQQDLAAMLDQELTS